MAYWLKSAPSIGAPSLCADLADAKIKLKRMVGIRVGDPLVNATVTWLIPEMKAELVSAKYGTEVFYIDFQGP